jgi:hypothetical protein
MILVSITACGGSENSGTGGNTSGSLSGSGK